MDNNINNSSCLSVGEGRIYIAINSLFASLGALANLLTILLIAWTRAYKTHVHRLTLYLAIFGLGFSVAVGLEVAPVDASGDTNNSTVEVREGWDEACAVIGFVAQHVGLSRSLAVLCVCLYVFLIAVCQANVQPRIYEATGVLIVTFAPATLSWVPFLRHTYGLAGTWCWIRDDCTVQFHDTFSARLRTGAAVIGDLVPITLSVALIASVSLVFCWRLRYRPNLRRQHTLALMELLPLTCYPLASAVSLYCGAINSVAWHLQSRYAGEMVTICLMQSAALVLPLSFLLHPSVRRRIVVRAKLSGSSRIHLAAQRHHTTTSTRHEGEHDHPASTEKSPLLAHEADRNPHFSRTEEN